MKNNKAFSQIKKLSTFAVAIIVLLSLTAILFACSGQKDKPQKEQNNNNNNVVQVIEYPEASASVKTFIPNGSFEFFDSKASQRYPYPAKDWQRDSGSDSAYMKHGVISLNKNFFDKHQEDIKNVKYVEGSDNERALLLFGNNDAQNKSKKYVSLSSSAIFLPTDKAYSKLIVRYNIQNFVASADNPSIFKMTVSPEKGDPISIEDKENTSTFKESVFYFENSNFSERNKLSKISLNLQGTGSVIIDYVDIVDSTKAEFEAAEKNKRISVQNPDKDFEQYSKFYSASDDFVTPNEGNSIYKYGTYNLKAGVENEKPISGSLTELNKKIDTIPTPLNLDPKPNKVFAISSQLGPQDSEEHKPFHVEIKTKQRYLILPRHSYKFKFQIYTNAVLNQQPLKLLLSSDTASQTMHYSAKSAANLVDLKDNLTTVEVTVTGHAPYAYTIFPSFVFDFNHSATISYAVLTNFVCEEVPFDPTGIELSYGSVTPPMVMNQNFEKDNKTATMSDLDQSKVLFNDNDSSVTVSEFNHPGLKFLSIEHKEPSVSKINSTDTFTLPMGGNTYALMFLAKTEDLEAKTNASLTFNLKHNNDPELMKLKTLARVNINTTNEKDLYNGFKLYVLFVKTHPTKNLEFNVNVNLGSGNRLSPAKLVKGKFYLSRFMLLDITNYEFFAKRDSKFVDAKKLDSRDFYTESLQRSSSVTNGSFFTQEYLSSMKMYQNYPNDFFTENTNISSFDKTKAHSSILPNGWKFSSNAKEKLVNSSSLSKDKNRPNATVDEPTSLSSDVWTSTDANGLKKIYKLKDDKAPLNDPSFNKDTYRKKFADTFPSNIVYLKDTESITYKEKLVLAPNKFYKLEIKGIITNSLKVTLGGSSVVLNNQDVDLTTNDLIEKNLIKETRNFIYFKSPVFENAEIDLKLEGQGTGHTFLSSVQISSSDVKNYNRVANGASGSNEYIAENIVASNVNVYGGIKTATAASELEGLPGDFSDINKNPNYLVLSSNTPSKNNYRFDLSSAFNLTANKNYVVTVYYKVDAGATADVVLANSSDSPVIRSYEAKKSGNNALTATTWTPIHFYFKTGLNNASYFISLCLGINGDKDNSYSGTVYFSCISINETFEENLKNIDNKYINTFTVDDFDDSTKVDGKNIEEPNKSWKLTKEDKIKTPEDYKAGVINFADKELITNTEKLLTEEEQSKVSSLGKALFINNIKALKTSYHTTYTLKKERAYLLKFTVYTNNPESTYITLSVGPKSYSYGIVDHPSNNVINLEKTTVKEYVFPINIEKEAEFTSIVLAVGLGTSNKKATGVAILDKVEITEVTKEVYTSYKSNQSVLSVNVAKASDSAAETPKNKKPEQKQRNTMLWAYASGGAISAALIVILIIFIIKRYVIMPKKGSKPNTNKKPNNKKKKQKFKDNKRNTSSRDKFNN